MALTLLVALPAVVPAAAPPAHAMEPPQPLLPRLVAAAAGPGDDRGLAGIEESAVHAVDGFWRRHFQRYFHRDYVSPRVLGAYHGTAGPSCDGDPALAFNAFYCKPGDFLAWDDALMAAGNQRIGDAWIYLIIAHEWGHAIQARVNHRLVSVADELQADCLAGATLHGAQQDRLIAEDPGDDREIERGLSAVADDYPWTATGDHGDAQQRIAAYRRGTRGGVPACF